MGSGRVGRTRKGAVSHLLLPPYSPPSTHTPEQKEARG